ncbi:MAG: PEP-CTERM sorting domain-containing protein [Desulfobulbaceae bacterium]|nr:PEP-CTERM sorting domain-containing protein [Desulfobulbaceae bacterium]
MKALTGLAFTLICTLAFVHNSSADIVWYEYTINGAALMNDYTLYMGTDVKDSPRDAGIFNGARQYTHYENNIKLRNYKSKWESLIFYLAAHTTQMRMAQFNLWGYGNVNDYPATAWCEDFLVQGWYNPASTDPNWQEYISPWPYGGTPPENNNGQLLGWYAPAGYEDGMGFFKETYPTFTFKMGVKDTTSWYDDTEGKLVFWFGGSMMRNTSNVVTGLYQGNIILQGTPTAIPEPATMVLFGIGLVCLAGGARKKAKKNK